MTSDSGLKTRRLWAIRENVVPAGSVAWVQENAVYWRAPGEKIIRSQHYLQAHSRVAGVVENGALILSVGLAADLSLLDHPRTWGFDRIQVRGLWGLCNYVFTIAELRQAEAAALNTESPST